MKQIVKNIKIITVKSQKYHDLYYNSNYLNYNPNFEDFKKSTIYNVELFLRFYGICEHY